MFKRIYFVHLITLQNHSGALFISNIDQLPKLGTRSMDLSGENKPMLKEYCFDKFIINVHLNFILLCGIMNWVIIFFLNEIEKKRDFTYDMYNNS